MDYPYAQTPTQDERTMAMLAHVLQLFGGFIGPLIIYLVRKDQSPFVRFHALQALLWHCAVMLAWMLVGGVWVVAVIALAISSGTGPQSAGPPPQVLAAMLALWGFALCMGLANLILAIVYGVKANRGEWAEYPLIGGLARRWSGV